jgi:hypothetical protein
LALDRLDVRDSRELVVVRITELVATSSCKSCKPGSALANLAFTTFPSPTCTVLPTAVTLIPAKGVLALKAEDG